MQLRTAVNDEPETFPSLDIMDQRLHHEIYLNDARKVAPEKLKTVIRHPIKKRGE